MREIKFRAWANGEMHNTIRGISFTHGFILVPYADESGESRRIDLKDCILLQFTGLLDKSGREIYEGDIVRITETLIEAFVWVKSEAGFKTQRIDKKGCPVLSDLLPRWPHYEAIGNIYENPELLKERE